MKAALWNQFMKPVTTMTESAKHLVASETTWLLESLRKENCGWVEGAGTVDSKSPLDSGDKEEPEGIMKRDSFYS